MFKPPFTVIIIKKTHEPLTFQVTYRFVITVFLLFCLVSTGAGFGISILMSRVNIPFLNLTAQGKTRDMSGARELSSDAGTGQVRLVSENAPAGVGNLTVIQTEQDQTGIGFSLSPVDSCETVYVWLIINPDALPGDDTAIYPRNPMFRGIPVDYRNGMAIHPSAESAINIDVTDLIYGTEFRTLKILAYSPDGIVLVNSTYEVNRGPGVS